MRTKKYQFIPVPCRLYFAVVLLLQIGLAFQQLHAQAIGGLPNKNANPKDSGSFVPTHIFNKPSWFMPLPGGGVAFINPGVIQEQNKTCQSLYCLDRKGSQTSFPNSAFSGSTFFQMGPGEVLGFCHPKSCNIAFGNPNPNVSNEDTIVCFRYSHGNSGGGMKSTRLVLNNPYRGDFRDGLQKRADQTFVYALSYNSDTAAVHNEIHLFNMGTDVVWNSQKTIIQLQLLEKVSVTGNNIFVLSRSNSTGIPGKTSIHVYNSQLQPVALNMGALDSMLVQGKIDVFKILADGKILIAGLLNQNGNPTNACLRLMPDGSEDPTFTKVIPGSPRGFKWDFSQDQRIRMAWIDSAASGVSAKMSLLGLNGGIESESSSLMDGTWPVGKALMYHPDLNAFLFETGDIIPERDWGGYYNMPAMAFRFYVGFDQKISPLVAEYGAQPYSWGTSETRVNNRLRKIVVTNTGFRSNRIPVFQYNGKLLPQIMVLNQDGLPDENFKSFLHFPKSLQQQIFQTQATMEVDVVGGNKLLCAYRSLDQPRSSMRTMTRFNFDGTEDAQFQTYSATPHPLELKDGSFVALQFNDSLASLTNTGSLTLIGIDSLGNKTGVKGQYTLDMNFDTLANSGQRGFTLVGEDNLKGIWLHVKNNLEFNSAFIMRNYLVRFDPSGSKVLFSFDSLRQFWTNDLIFEHNRAFYPTVLPDGKFEIWTNARGEVVGNTVRYYHKLVFGPTGNLISKSQIFSSADGFGPRGGQTFRILKRLSDGKFLARLFIGGFERYLVRFHSDGRFDPSFIPINCRDNYLNMVQQFGNQLLIGFLPPRAIYDDPDNFICGPLSKNGLYSFTLNTLPEDKAFVQGKVEQVVSPATGCNPTGTRTPTPFTLITASPGGEAGLIDKNGFYSLLVNPGNHQINQQNDNDFLRRQICPAPPNLAIPVAVPQAGDVSLNNNFLNQTFNCPRLTMQLLQPRFRLCSRSQFIIRYSNDGMATEPNARIRVNLPQAVKLLSASMPFSTQGDSSYVFAIGSLAPGASGTIKIQDTVACISTPDSLVRACFSVRMEPLSVCGEVAAANISWNGAWLDAKAQYNQSTGNVRFAVYNRGSNMTDSTTFRFSPGQATLPSKIKLLAGDSLVFFVPGIDVGRYRLDLAQPQNCPLGTDGVLVHAGRTTAPFYLSFGNGWFMGQTATACPAFRFSYDPNEKVVEPIDPVDPGTELNYTIHFENYGNDTAYAVVVTDTLPAGVDISSFRMVGSSHECRPSIDGTTGHPIVNFNFLPIRLPGKKQDSVLSKGQVDFKIRLKDNVALGSVHQNKAHIYFDRNEPIITNTTVTKVRNPDETTEVQERLGDEKRMMLFPNPTRHLLSVVLPTGYESTEIQIGDIQGRICLKRHISRIGTIDVSTLQGGVYMVRANGLKTERLIVIH